MSKQKSPKQRIVVQISYFNEKPVSKNKYTVSHSNKDGTLTKYGVSRGHHKFREKILTIDNTESISLTNSDNDLILKKKLEKIFNTAKKDIRKNEHCTIVGFWYTGIYHKKGNWVDGIKGTAQRYAVAKRVGKEKTRRNLDIISKPDRFINAMFINMYFNEEGDSGKIAREQREAKLKEKSKSKAKSKHRGVPSKKSHKSHNKESNKTIK